MHGSVDSLDTNLSLLSCLDKVERALFCDEKDAIYERNAILRVIGEIERCNLDFATGRLTGAGDWVRRGLLNDDASLRSLNLAWARLLKAAGLLYGFGDYAARGRSLEESLLAESDGTLPPFRDESALPAEVRAYYALMDENRRDLRAEIRPGGGASGAPFWNVNARLFTYPPSFPFRTIPGAATYRFEVLDDAHRLRTFSAATPDASLAPVWAAIPAGFVEVRCHALDAAGVVIGEAGTRRFWRAAPFDPAEYSPATRTYREARRAILAHLLSWPELADLALYSAEGHQLDLAKARALGNSMVRNQNASGRLRTYWIPEPGDGSDFAGAVRLPLGGNWFNCMVADAMALGALADAAEAAPDSAAGFRKHPRN